MVIQWTLNIKDRLARLAVLGGAGEPVCQNLILWNTSPARCPAAAMRLTTLSAN